MYFLLVLPKLERGILEGIWAFSLHFSKFRTCRLSHKILKTCMCIHEIGGGAYWKQFVHFHWTSQSSRPLDLLTKYWKHAFVFLKLGGGVYWRQLVHFPCTSQSLRFVDFLTKYFKHVFAFLKLGGGVYWKQFVHFHWTSQSLRHQIHV